MNFDNVMITSVLKTHKIEIIHFVTNSNRVYKISYCNMDKKKIRLDKPNKQTTTKIYITKAV